jgi:hypothetical protein
MIGRITRIFISVSVFLWILWASLAVLLGGQMDSISAHVRDYCSMYPLIPFGMGVVVGHWFWSMGPAVRRDGK